MDIYKQEETACIHSASYHIMKAVKIMLLGVFVHPQTHGWLVGLVSEITRVFNKTKNNECVKSEKAMVKELTMVQLMCKIISYCDLDRTAPAICIQVFEFP